MPARIFQYANSELRVNRLSLAPGANFGFAKYENHSFIPQEGILVDGGEEERTILMMTVFSARDTNIKVQLLRALLAFRQCYLGSRTDGGAHGKKYTRQTRVLCAKRK